MNFLKDILKNIPFKDLALKYGEKAGLGLAVALMLLLALMGLLATRTDAPRQEDIKQAATTAESKLRSLRPPEAHEVVPEGTPSGQELVARVEKIHQVIPPYIVRSENPPLLPDPLSGNLRDLPLVYAPVEVVGAPTHVAYRAQDIRGEQVVVVQKSELGGLKVKGTGDPRKRHLQGARMPPMGGMGGMPGSPGMGGGMVGGPGMMPGGPGMGGMGGRPGSPGMGGGPGMMAGGPGMGGGPGMMPGASGRMARPGGRRVPASKKPGPEKPAAETTTLYQGVLKKLDEFDEEKDEPAVTLLPYRAVLIEGSYPHEAQMREIARATRQKFEEVIASTPYLFVEAERRWILPKGRRLPDGTVADKDYAWIPKEQKFLPLDPENPEVPDGGWVAVSLQHVESLLSVAEDGYKPEEKLEPVSMEGLTMALLQPHRGDYPDLTTELSRIQQTLTKLAGKKVVTPKRSPLRRSDTSPFKRRPRTGGGETGPSRGGQQTKPERGGSPSTAGESIPEYGLARFLDIDPSLQPGQTYQYRLRVVLQNPNLGVPETSVIDPSYAYMQQLPGPWSPPTAPITLPEELHIYVDEPSTSHKLEEKGKLQIEIHKWLDVVRRLEAEEVVPVCEWCVERRLVARGDYVGRPEPMDLVAWVSTAPDPQTQTMGLHILRPKFETDAFMSWTMLVDYEGGTPTTRVRLGNKTVSAEPPVEALLLQPDGRLVARYQLEDRGDDTRRDRVAAWEAWKKEAQKKLGELSETHKKGKKKEEGSEFKK